ncbi:MAG: hypothetical protein M1835_002507 [Candelina submexicana]|nr:MAG: hypothetical protein M1835_002507 [Candelina submexicana]
MASSKPSKTQSDLSTLRLTVISTLCLIDQFTTSRTTAHTSPPTQPPINAPNPLDVLHTTATLLKAQTTKLSLLVLNKPFTPSAISTILRDVSTSCLPALMSAVEICDPEKYSKILHDEVRLRVRRVLQEFAGLVGEIPIDDANDDGGNGAAKRDQLAFTGVVWEACDSLIALRNEGLVGVVVKKAKDWRAMIEDAIAELKEWAEEKADSDEEDEDGTESAGTGSQDGINGDDGIPENADFDAIFGPTRTLPAGPSPLRTQLELSIAKLSLVQILYQAIIKRRLKVLPPFLISSSASSPSSVTAPIVDELVTHLSIIPSETDELASAFYELNHKDATERYNRIIQVANDAASVVGVNWNGEEDGNTEWFKKWSRLVARP